MSDVEGDETKKRKIVADARIASRLFTRVRPWWTLVAVALVLIAIQAVLQLAGPLITRWVIDSALPQKDLQAVTTAALLFALALFVQLLASYSESMCTALLGQRVMRDLRKELFAHIQRLPISYFDRTPVGRLVTRTTSDVEALNELFTSGVVAGMGDIFTLTAISVVMLWIDWQLALAAFLVIPLVYISSRIFRAKVRVAYDLIRLRLAHLNSFVQERLSGIRVVQLFGREKDENSRFEELNDSHLDAHLSSIRVYALYFPIIEFLTTLALASLVVVGGYRIGMDAITVGTLAAFLQLVRRFFQPLQDLSEKFNILQAAMAGAERIFSLLDTPAAEGSSITENRAERVEEIRKLGVTVEFVDVWFHYGSSEGITEDSVAPVIETSGSDGFERWVLKGISFKAGPGETVALVGHTGAGKSTIVNLLLRFYEPQRGQILLNGVDIRVIPTDVLRSLVGYVQQDIFFFAGDIAGNIRLSTGADQSALDYAASLTGADKVIGRLPGGWSHRLHERGAGISVGERQLLAFSRAVVADPALLILDEATSAVDSEIEAEIRGAVASLMKGRTTISIAHRLSTIADATEILVLHHGEVVERGTHSSLISQRGQYERLIRLENGPEVGNNGIH